MRFPTTASYEAPTTATTLSHEIAVSRQRLKVQRPQEVTSPSLKELTQLLNLQTQGGSQLEVLYFSLLLHALADQLPVACCPQYSSLASSLRRG